MYKILRYYGSAIRNTEIQVPGWAGKETNDSCQFWHIRQFVDCAEYGAELVYEGDEICIDETVRLPFRQLSDQLYFLKTDVIIVSPLHYDLLIMPHYRYYTDDEWATPLSVPCRIQADWYPKSLTINFRMPPKGHKHIFRSQEPYAQLLLVPRQQYKPVALLPSELNDIQGKQKFLSEHGSEYITRKWKTAHDVEQDNLYNVLASLAEKSKLPDSIKPKKKPYKLFRKTNVY